MYVRPPRRIAATEPRSSSPTTPRRRQKSSLPPTPRSSSTRPELRRCLEGGHQRWREGRAQGWRPRPGDRQAHRRVPDRHSLKSWVQPQGGTPQAKPYTPPTSAAGTRSRPRSRAPAWCSARLPRPPVGTRLGRFRSGSTTTGSAGSGSTSSTSARMARTCRPTPTANGQTPSTPSRWRWCPRSSPCWVSRSGTPTRSTSR